ALNPVKISGVCGRLMCCLSYEYGMYEGEKREKGDRPGRGGKGGKGGPGGKGDNGGKGGTDGKGGCNGCGKHGPGHEPGVEGADVPAQTRPEA
ncbi:MAG: hypothetical protein HZB84_06160, partial [Deltaproteobacteria bacterium]|nr:hypothetical protein [Deltaproteobacteria bacterium]